MEDIFCLLKVVFVGLCKKIGILIEVRIRWEVEDIVNELMRVINNKEGYF